MTDLTHAASAITTIAQELARSNAEADRAEYERLATRLREAISNPRIGVWNTLALLPDVLRDYAGETTEHYSEAECDYLFAASVIEAACVGVDLKYGDGSRQSNRRVVLERLMTAMKGVRV